MFCTEMFKSLALSSGFQILTGIDNQRSFLYYVSLGSLLRSFDLKILEWWDPEVCILTHVGNSNTSDNWTTYFGLLPKDECNK